MLVLSTPNHDGKTLLSYDLETGRVHVKITSPTTIAPAQQTMALAQFLREMGIPFKHVRDITRVGGTMEAMEPEVA